jgi:hypothetical protein
MPGAASFSVAPGTFFGSVASKCGDQEHHHVAVDLHACEALSVERKMFERSGDLLPPSPPAEKATARQDQAGKASTGDGTGDRCGRTSEDRITSCANRGRVPSYAVQRLRRCVVEIKPTERDAWAKVRGGWRGTIATIAPL